MFFKGETKSTPAASAGDSQEGRWLLFFGGRPEAE